MARLALGACRFVHGAPFDTAGLIAVLGVIGLPTSFVFFLSRDVFGVVKARAAQDDPGAFRTVQVPLVGPALAALRVLVASDRLILRRK